MKELMIRSMKVANEAVAAVPELAYTAEEAMAIGLSLFVSSANQGS
jgi:hypothetical protein